MDRLIVESIRCFHTRQSAPLKPITLLVGENSTGKTTFLALARIAWDLCQGRTLVDFNKDPFLLGAYDHIASYRGGRGGRAKHFTIGAQVSPSSDLKRRFPRSLADEILVTGRFVRKEAQPKLTAWSLDAGSFRVDIRLGEEEKPPIYSVQTPSGTANVSDIRLFEPIRIPDLMAFLRYALSQKTRGKAAPKVTTTGTVNLSQLVFFRRLTYELLRSIGPRPYPFAPIRTRPQRTYDPIKDVPRPEGSHVPIILARIFSSGPEDWEEFVEPLDSFGKASGLFSDVKVRRMGPKGSGPFQIMVKISGPDRNLVDVGYGVSQALPIIVDSYREPKGSTFLLQQPEVHLHPKAQAQLGSFLGYLAKKHDKRFLIETHSDYLVDRIRMDLRNKEYLEPDDVCILYFERENGGVTIHHLELDAFGKIVNAPPGYRQFFLEEERTLLGA